MLAEPDAPAGASRPKGGVSRRELGLLLGLLALAAVVRLGWPGLTEFKADEGRLLTLALDMADGRFATHGLSSSVGFPNAPMSVWIYVLPLVLWPHAYAATLFTGLLGVLAVAGIYWLARRFWGMRAALAATLMFVVSPWAILFSRKIWAQNLLQIFAVGWAISAVLAFIEGRRVFLVFHIVLLAVAIQIHPSSLGLLPATAVFLIIFRRRVHWRYVMLGGLLALLTAAPFLWYLWGRWQVSGGLPFSSGQSSASVSLDSVRLTASIAIGDGLAPIAGSDYSVPIPGVLARAVWLAFIVVATGWTAFRVRRHWQSPAAQAGFICLAWLAFPALFFLWHRTPVYVHYFIVSLPAAYILAGALFARVLESISSRARTPAWVGFVAVAVIQLAVVANLMVFVARHPTNGGFGVPLGVKLKAADAARAMLARTGAEEILLAGRGSNPEHDDFPAEFEALLHGVPVRTVDLTAEAVFPSAASIVLSDLSVIGEDTSTYDFYRAASGEVDADGLNDQNLYTVRSLDGGAAPTPDVPLPEPALFANFVHLLGYGLSTVDPSGVIWDIIWRTADNPDPADYHFFNHLGVAGERFAQADGRAFPGEQWRPGDVVISRFRLPITGGLPPAAVMRVGMYRFPSLENVPVLDEAANPASDAVEIELSR